MAEARLHLVFNITAAKMLREALKLAGKEEDVIDFPDCLSCGPIGNVTAEERIAWVQNELGDIDWWKAYIKESQALYRQARADTRHKILWVSHRIAMEYAGFLHFLFLLGDTPCDVVNLTDTLVPAYSGKGQILACSLAFLNFKQISEGNILHQAKPLTPEQTSHYHAMWEKLCAENAPFRITDGTHLISAPINCFDAQVLSCASSEWQKCAYTVAKAMVVQMDEDLYQSGDEVLFSRIRQLVKLGRLESRGDISDMRQSEVRLPNGNN